MLSCDNMYNLPTTRHKRATSTTTLTSGFGIGKKTDLDVGKDPHNISPPPNTYNVPTFAQENAAHKSGFNIAIGREFTAPVSYIPLEPQKVIHVVYIDAWSWNSNTAAYRSMRNFDRMTRLDGPCGPGPPASSSRRPRRRSYQQPSTSIMKPLVPPVATATPSTRIR